MIFILSYLNSFFFNFVIIKSIPIIFLLLFSIIIGIITSFNFPGLLKTSLIIYIILACSTSILLITLLWRTKQNLFSFIVCVNFVFIGVLASHFKNLEVGDCESLHKKHKELICKSLGPTEEKANSYKMHVDLFSKDQKSKLGSAILYFEKNEHVNNIAYGDIILLKNNFAPIKLNGNPFEFNYKRYLRIHGISYQGYIKSNEWKIIHKASAINFSFILKIQSRLNKLIDATGMNQQNKAIAKALLLGKKQYLDRDTLDSFSGAGAMHILAVSGLHVGIIMLILQLMLKPIKLMTNGKLIHKTLVIAGIWIYALVTGFSPSVFRAALMFSFIILGHGLQRHVSIYQSIAVSAFMILIFDPFSLFKVGFQLSYSAVLGIVYLQPKLYRLVYIKPKILNYFWQITTVSLAAQITTFPLSLFYFHQFPNLFFVSNIVIIPLAAILLFVGFIYFLTHKITFLKDALEFILDQVFSFLNFFVETIDNIPMSTISGVSISRTETLLYYLIIVSLTLFWTLKKKISLFISLSLASLFLTIQIFEKNNIQQTNLLTIYNVKNDLAIDIFKGQHNIFICSATLLENEAKLLFHIKNHWYHRLGKAQPDKVSTITNLKNIVFRFNDQSFLILNNTKLSIPKTDYVIVRTDNNIPPTVENYWLNANTKIIIHPDTPSTIKKYLKFKFPMTRIYDLGNEGAFQLSYK